MPTPTNQEMLAEIGRWKRCQAALQQQRDQLQEQIAECERVIQELYRR